MKFKPHYDYWNDEEDFKMPYRVYGNLDKENLLVRYRNLSNNPRLMLETRFTAYQW